MYKMCEKLASDVSLKYLSPGEELSPDNLISVTDDDDVQASHTCLSSVTAHSAVHVETFPRTLLSLFCCKHPGACGCNGPVPAWSKCLQEMFAEYWRGHVESDAKQSFRMTLMLFEAFDPDDFEDAEAAWQTTRYAHECRIQELRLCCPGSLSMRACMSRQFTLALRGLRPITSTSLHVGFCTP